MKKLAKLKQNKIESLTSIKAGTFGGRGPIKGLETGVQPTFSNSNDLTNGYGSDQITDGCTGPF